MLGRFTLLNSIDSFVLTATGMSGSLTYPGTPVVGELYEHFDPTFGNQFFKCVFNDSGTDIAAGKCAVYKAGSDYLVLVSTTILPKGRVAGVCIKGIPDDNWGYVLIGGSCHGEADAAIAADADLCLADASAAHGRLDDVACAAAGQANDYWATALTAATNPGDAFHMKVWGLL